MADTSVGRVTVALALDTKGLKDGAAKATKTVETLGKDLEKVGKEGSDDFQRIEDALKELGRALSSINQSIVTGFNKSTQSIEKADKSLAHMKRTTDTVDDSVTKAKMSLGDMASKAQAVGTKMSLAVTAPLLATGVQAVRTANQFDFAMASITGLVGIAADEVKKMEVGVRSMAMEFGVSAVDAAKALYFVTSAGLTGSEAMGVLEQSLKASSVGMGETMIIADTVSSALNAYGVANLSAAEATDLMFASVREGKMEADALAGALPRVLPIASAMGVKFQEVGAAFAAMSRNGTDASEAGTQIRGILASLLNPTKQAEEQLSALGLSSAGLRQSIKDDGLLKTLKTLTDSFNGNDEAAATVFGNIRALTGIMSMFGSATESTEKIFANLTDNTGDLDKAFTAMSQTGQFKTNQAMAAMKDAMISLGQTLGPIVLPIIQAITGALSKMASMFSGLPGPIKTVLVILTGLLAAAGPLLILVGSLAKAFLALKAAMATQAFASALAQMTAFGPVIAGIALAVAAVAIAYTLFSSSSKEAEDRQKSLTSALKAGGDEAALLTDNVKTLITEYEKLNPTAMTNPLTASNGAEAFVLTEITADKLNDTFTSLGLTISDITKTVSTGTDFFDMLSAELDLAESNGTGLDAAIQDLSSTGNGMYDSLLRMAQSGQITGEYFLSMIDILDGLSDAFDDNREALDSDAKAMLTNADTVTQLSNILGSDALSALIASSLATAEAEGRTDKYAYALENVRLAVEATLDPMRLVTDAEIEVAKAAALSTDGLAQLDGVMVLLKASSDDGKIAITGVADQLGVLNELLANEVQLELINAQEASDKLYTSFSGLSDGSIDVEKAVRQQMSSMLGLIGKITQLGGSSRDVLPTLIAMYNDMLDAADAAGISRTRIMELIEQIGLLDGLSPEIRMYLTMDVSEVQAQIANVMRMFGGVSKGGDLEKRLLGQLSFLNDVLKLLKTTPKSTGGGGGGGGGRSSTAQAKDDFSWVEGWVSSIADFANDLISTDFRDKLLNGSAKDIADTFKDILNKAADLKIDKLPAFASLIDQLRTQFADLGNLATTRDLLGDQIDTATDKLKDLKSTLDDVQKAASKWTDRIGTTTPTLTLLEQANNAQDKYDELYAKAQQLKNDRTAFIGQIEGAINQPLTSGNIMGDTSKLLTEARSFRDNLIALQDRGFGTDVIQQVAQAGMIEGNKIAKSLLSLSNGDMAAFTAMRAEIASIANQAATVVADLVFTADITDAEAAVAAQTAIVTTLYANALSSAQAAVATQQTIVDSLKKKLDAVNTSIVNLTYAIQTQLSKAMTTFLSGFTNAVALLTGSPVPGSIPAMASGGIVSSPTLLMAGEAGSEAIIPLSRLGDMSGDTVVYVTVNGSVSSERDLVESVRIGLLKAQKSGRQVVL